MVKSLNDWLSEGESIYAALLEEYQRSEAQIAELEHRLSSMIVDVNQIAQVIGKPTIDKHGHESHGPGSPGPGAGHSLRTSSGNVAVKVL